MKRIFLIVVQVVLFSSQASAALKVNEPAPLFSLQDMTGKEFFLGNLVGAGVNKGNGVMVSFFASWCIPCRIELPIMNSVAGEFRSKGITVVLIDVKEHPDTIKALLKELKVDQLIVLSDSDGKTGEKFGLRFLPTTFFIGADGNVKDVIYGGIESASQLRTSAGKLIKE